MKIVVLAGGISPERDVSLNSGKMIYDALKQKEHQVILLDVYLGYQAEIVGDVAAIFSQNIDWAADIVAIKSESPDIAAVKLRRPDKDKSFFGPNVIGLCQAADVVFIALHGESGENGKIQAFFDLMGICYTGSGHMSSAIAMDKMLAKELFGFHKIPTPQSFALKKGEKKPAALIEYPLIVKANNGGSSVGMTIARTDDEFALAVDLAFQYDEIALVEKYIEGREFSIAILFGKALPVVEIAPKQGFFDYHNKYQPGATVETCPAKIPEEAAETLKQYAEKVYQILRLSNYARVDFMMDKAGNFYCLEANTLPGMAPTSLLPQEAAVKGIGFGDLCEGIIKDALAKNRGII
ncbi:MAG: D-alanine--D-alanine ligase [Lachnospiraceae bacterium]|nr:D-alanine--D-alanine ligase [Lachnospiraceae bacterium]